MPGSSDISRGNIAFTSMLMLPITPAAGVPDGGSSVQDYPIKGLHLYDLVIVAPQAPMDAALILSAAWVSAPGVLSIQWSNVVAATDTPPAPTQPSTTASSATPTPVMCLLQVSRMSNAAEGASAFPNTFV